ncbi:hypothetical protein HF1_08660 [Mycoplasma haemofelis str. Langford 1]|uniref:Uncharacterized protein n=1 Tax=Mycoplasma haemofelis (strain Langford 1) TaxID=941640 RepID=E8ZIA3_MYCHL|nr:hypothetical protein [Mycoplasma haemofelis]CBY92874.1 hypothetical protein HF1_08660 [Mycoplasma haemofelis str. Langford 1]
MSKAAAASLAGLGGAAGIGGGIYLLNSNSKTPTYKKGTVGHKLQSEKFTILNAEGDADHWKLLKEEYNKAKSTTSKVFESHTSDIEEGKLKELCKSALEKDEGDASYSKAKRWCVVPVSVSEYLKNWNIVALPTNTDNSDKQDKWTALANSYESSNNKISNVATLSDQKWQTLRAECKKLEVKKNYDDDFDSAFGSSKIWCVEK